MNSDGNENLGQVEYNQPNTLQSSSGMNIRLFSSTSSEMEILANMLAQTFAHQ